MVKRAMKRAARRVRGDHPRRTADPARFGLYVLCDLLLLATVISFFAGLAFTVIGLLGAIGVADLVLGLALIGLSILLLILWEKVFWDPFAHHFDELS
jgi:hypothetical protein